MMYVDGTLISSNDRFAAADLATVRTFLDTHGTALANAAYLLGGGDASGLVFNLIESIRSSRCLSSASIRRLEKLYGLLVLESVEDPDRLETALFAEIIPGSRMVEEICLLADNLDDLLNGLGSHEGVPSEPGDEAFSEAA